MTALAEAVELPADIWDAMTRLDFLTFVSRVMAELEPGTVYEENWHLEVIADRLLAVQDGANRRLIINMPPRAMKTITVSIAFAAWILGHDPTRRIMCVTYSNDVAKAQATQFVRIVRSGWYRRCFPECRPAVPNRTLEWQTTKGGYRLATSIEGSVLGRGADYIILDDPNKGQEIFSKVARTRVTDAWDNTISTRLNHPKESAIICVMQRLHDEDLAGHLLEQENYELLSIPAIATQKETRDLGNGRSHVRRKGEFIQPTRMGKAELDRQKKIMGATAFSAQYQQQPVPDDGVVIRRAWLRYCDEYPEEFETTLVSWDTASTLSENADWSVGTVWGQANGEIWLLDVIRERMEAPGLTRLIENTHIENDADITLVEDADLGRAIAQNLFNASRRCRPQLVKPRIEKIARMQARAVMFETGKIILPREAPWLTCYLEELLGFPNRRHDDQVDSTSQALDWFQRRMRRDLASERPARKRSSGGRNRPQGAPLRWR
ncbi:terminase [Croceicoccus ponticola]|uniref:Terminase n=1 Tax=Croceicoccus ponticola TaxID=2217664 RepID=A0A437GUF8_9SPHN|nr:phage terminase large subunit [Croceicoccus ponticola]RVQ65008.1 terminase [Croceicoccus ponticola]